MQFDIAGALKREDRSARGEREREKKKANNPRRFNARRGIYPAPIARARQGGRVSERVRERKKASRSRRIINSI